MPLYAGIDVSLNTSYIYVVDNNGDCVCDAVVDTGDQSLVDWFVKTGISPDRIGLEAGPQSQWLYGALKKAGLAAELIDTRHAHTAFKLTPVKTDRNDARGIAQLMRLGWFRPVHCKSIPAQELRAILTTRKLIQSKLRDIEMGIRGILRGFGLKLGAVGVKTFADRVKNLVAHHPTLEEISETILLVRDALIIAMRSLERRVAAAARDDIGVQRLRTTPGVGAIVALTFVAAIDDPNRFRHSRDVGPYFGLTPRLYQSGETRRAGRITKIGDSSVRTALYQAANVIMTQSSQSFALKNWALKVAERSGKRKAKVALARKLGVILHMMLRDKVEFAPYPHEQRVIHQIT